MRPWRRRTFRHLWRNLAMTLNPAPQIRDSDGVRRKEALGARWREFDLEKRVWIVPGERMKMKRDHAVPLTDAMVACLGPRGADDALVFPSRRTGRMLGHDALSMREHGATLHGFRSTLSTWAEEQDDGRAYPRPSSRPCLPMAKATR